MRHPTQHLASTWCEDNHGHGGWDKALTPARLAWGLATLVPRVLLLQELGWDGTKVGWGWGGMAMA